MYCNSVSSNHDAVFLNRDSIHCESVNTMCHVMVDSSRNCDFVCALLARGRKVKMIDDPDEQIAEEV
jgi:hypothetical protein